MKPLSRIGAPLLIAAYAWSTTAHGAWVLCHGADGHVTVEASGLSCCLESEGEASVEAPAPHEGAGSLSVAPADGCGACTDVPMFVAPGPHVGPGALKAIAGEPLAASAPAFLPTADGQHPALGLADPPRPGGSDSPPGVLLQRLRTVVLRR